MQDSRSQDQRSLWRDGSEEVGGDLERPVLEVLHRTAHPVKRHDTTGEDAEDMRRKKSESPNAETILRATTRSTSTQEQVSTHDNLDGRCQANQEDPTD